MCLSILPTLANTYKLWIWKKTAPQTHFFAFSFFEKYGENKLNLDGVPSYLGVWSYSSDMADLAKLGVASKSGGVA